MPRMTNGSENSAIKVTLWRVTLAVCVLISEVSTARPAPSVVLPPQFFEGRDGPKRGLSARYLSIDRALPECGLRMGLTVDVRIWFGFFVRKWLQSIGPVLSARHPRTRMKEKFQGRPAR